MTIGDIPHMYFHAELFIRTLDYYSNIEYEFTLIVMKATDPMNWTLHEGHSTNQYLSRKNIEIFYSPACYKTHPTLRWQIKPRAKICAFIDADLLICSDLKEFLQNINNNCVNATIALQCPITMDQWKKMFHEFGITYNSDKTFLTTEKSQECPFYANYGNVIVPSELIEHIKNPLEKNLQKLEKFDLTCGNYFNGQIGLTLTLEELKIPRKELSIRYNFPDFDQVLEKHKQEFESLSILHYINRKYYIKNKTSFHSDKDVFWQTINNAIFNSVSHV